MNPMEQAVVERDNDEVVLNVLNAVDDASNSNRLTTASEASE